MPHRIEELHRRFDAELKQVTGLEALLDLRDRYLGREKGILSQELKRLGRLPKDHRPEYGRLANQLKDYIEGEIQSLTARLRQQEEAERLNQEHIDLTLPGRAYPTGRPHPLVLVKRQIEEIFVKMGFTVVDGPEVDTDYYNFEALNMPKDHPARDTQDTFYLSEEFLLRTHTSPVQIHYMEKHQPPFRIVVPGRVFRRDNPDPTHSPMFFQVEGLVVGEAVSLADLKGTLEFFLRELFSPDTRARFRPSYFPFVEPGAEVDISCIFCRGTGCRMCKMSGWIEILGAGMVHPKIFERVGYDSQTVSGFAWGMGVDRIAMLKYGVDDIRLFYENDLRFIEQFS
ncbi:MAG: phenylalanine--tRNA ligase subunit alpha [Acidobacteria bacterium]|nr:phenylalanine--tRNA ligase subunit alpha [Acidobacteriota bacterium]